MAGYRMTTASRGRGFATDLPCRSARGGVWFSLLAAGMKAGVAFLGCLTLWLCGGSLRAEVAVAVQVTNGVETLKSFLSWKDFQAGTVATTRTATNQEGSLVAWCSHNGQVTALRNIRGTYYLYDYSSFSNYIKGEVTTRSTAGRRHIPAIRGLATDGVRYWAQTYAGASAHLITYSSRSNLLTGVSAEDLDLGWPADLAGDVAYSGGEVHLVYDGQVITYDGLENYRGNHQSAVFKLPSALASLVALTAEAGDLDPLAAPVPGLTGEESGLSQLVPVAGYLNGAFPTNIPGVGGWQVVNAFTNVGFVEPMQVLADPSRPGNLLVVGLNGQIWRIPNDPAASANSKQLVLDISGEVERLDNDHGLYRIELHPQFANTNSRKAGLFYAIYMHPRPDLPGYLSGFTKYWRLSRFTMNLTTGIVDPGSEVILINQYCPGIWHNGGGMTFGPDGMLYVTVGDNERAAVNTQILNHGLRSGVLRIDVDMNPARSHPIRRQPTSAEVPAGWPASFSANYYIPNDNPWLSPDGSRLEEFYAVGLRNPYTMSLDASTGQFWIGDVGEVTSEEINLLDQPGLNFQWPYREGNTQMGVARPAEVIGTERGPEMIYGHSDGGAILCGFVYRGDAYAAELGGELLISDNSSGTIWAYDPVARRGKRELANAGAGGGVNMGVVNLCAGPTGEIFVPFQAGRGGPDGRILKLVPATVSAQLPTRLSETHAFKDLVQLTPHPAFIPYTPAAPLWSDAADKFRWIAVPNDGSAAEKISVAEENWRFPAGTVLMKHFEIPLDENNPAIRKRLETRFIVCLPDGGKYGVTYQWLEDGSDAVLATGRSTMDYAIKQKSGGTVSRQWTVPSRADCLYCHNAVSGQALGLKFHQLNHPLTYPATGKTRNQLATLGYLGLLSPAPDQARLSSALKAHSLGDETAPLEHRVRSYLDSNCSHCHQPGAGGPGFDARLYRPLVHQSLINESIHGHFAFVPGGKLVAPGDVARSAVHFRTASDTEGAEMPPVGRSLEDAAAVDGFAHWIRSLHPEEFTNAQAPAARYFRLRTLSEVNGQPWAAIAELRILGAEGAPYPQSELVVASVSSENFAQIGALAIDGDDQSMWISQWAPDLEEQPHLITLDLGSVKPIAGFEYQPRRDGIENGRVARWETEISVDGTVWKPFLSGTFANTDVVQRRVLGGGELLWPVRPQIGVPGSVAAGDFNVVITTDTDVTDFVLADLAAAVTNGRATALRGSGHYYVATIHPTGGPVSIRLAENVMGNGFSAASNTVTVGYLEEPPLLSADILSAPGSGGQVRLLLNLDQPLPSAGSVRLYARSGTALEGHDFVAFDQTVTLPAGVSSVDVSLPLIQQEDSVVGRTLFLELEPGVGFTVAQSEVRIQLTGTASGVLTDSDQDGLPDAWEIAHFGDLSPTAEGDPDGDLVSNLLEYLLGTAPEVAGDFMAITSLELTPGGVTVSWLSVPGMTYDVYISPDLTTWTRPMNAAVPSMGEYTSAILGLPAGLYDKQFFVKVVGRDSN